MKRTLVAPAVHWLVPLLFCWMPCVAGCEHPVARSATSASVLSGTRPLASDPLPDLSTLRLAMKQVPSGTDVTFEFTLTNTGREPVQITTNPRFRDRTMAPVGDRGRDTEVEFRIEDQQGRLVPAQCLFSSAWRGYRAETVLLSPGQNRSFSFSLMQKCYSLVSGERLSVSASYANLFDDEARAARGVPVVRAPASFGVVVPPGWPVDQATQQGYASDRVAPGPR